MRRSRRRRIGTTAVGVTVGAALALALSACATPPRRAASTTSSRPPTPRTSQGTTSTSTPATTSTTAQKASACVASPAGWTAQRLSEQLLMVIGHYTALGALVPEAAAGVGGVVLLGEPAQSQAAAIRSGLSSLSSAAAAAGQVTPWASTDTEGGPVSRLAHVVGSLPSERQMAAQWSTSRVQSALAARGAALRELGVTMDLAPVLDTASATDPVADESQRSFSATPHVAGSYGVAFATGLREAGVIAVAKHFPGLGHASANTDTGPSVDPPLAQLETDDLVPFEEAVAAGVPVIMVGHPVVPGLTSTLPASLSSATYGLLRSTLHFSGVTMTDSLAAGAISAAGYSQAAAAVTAVRAGADMPMVDASTWQASVAALAQAVSNGDIPLSRMESAVKRILAVKGLSICGT